MFIHGLQGNPRRTWRYKGEIEHQVWVEESEKKKVSFPKRLFKSKQTHAKKGTWEVRRDKVSIFWPADVLPVDFKNVRIITYGYDSRVTKFFGGLANKNNIDNYGRDFLTDLEAVRRGCVSCL